MRTFFKVQFSRVTINIGSIGDTGGRLDRLLF